MKTRRDVPSYTNLSRITLDPAAPTNQSRSGLVPAPRSTGLNDDASNTHAVDIADLHNYILFCRDECGKAKA